jgi:light-regulated signal transduction histidine kinase (bacteriophytochrome)
MQSFSYSISHDLRAPLRAINGFSKIVLAESAGKFDQETVDHLGRIAAGAERMGRLIDDLLHLSQVSRKELHRQAANLSELAGEVAGNLAQAHPERQVEILIAPAMMVDADRGLVHIALENLIGNAWKFTSRTNGARIEIGQQECDGEMVCFVRDNGAGFDMRYADKLFGAFQRLHTSREFEGTGIGLSIVQRIVMKHGGRIWAEAKPGEGATLYFTLAQGTRAV